MSRKTPTHNGTDDSFGDKFAPIPFSQELIRSMPGSLQVLIMQHPDLQREIESISGTCKGLAHGPLATTSGAIRQTLEDLTKYTEDLRFRLANLDEDTRELLCHHISDG